MSVIKVNQAERIFREHNIRRVSRETYDALGSVIEQLISEIAESHSRLYPGRLLTSDTLYTILKERGYNFKANPTITSFSEDEVIIYDSPND